jgi:hypothetical protein
MIIILNYHVVKIMQALKGAKITKKQNEIQNKIEKHGNSDKARHL